MYRRLVTILVTVFMSIPAIAYAGRIYVPQDASTIQAGIDIALDGDTVLVAPGTYQEIIDFAGKSICLKGEKGADSTVLTYPERCDRLIAVGQGADTPAVLDGFMVSNVQHNYGVIAIGQSSMTVRNCKFVNNSNLKPSPTSWGVIAFIGPGVLTVEGNVFEGNRSYSSAGLGVQYGEVVVKDNLFAGNEAFGDYGGAVGIGGVFGRSHARIEGNVFVQNTAGHGGAIFLSENDTSLVQNNTFVGNTSADGGAICIWYYCSGIRIFRNIFVGNSPYAVTNDYGSSGILDCNDAVQNIPENYPQNVDPGGDAISLDPLFCDTATEDYHLAANSPCASENSPCSVQIGALPVGCGAIVGVHFVDTAGSDSTGDGTEDEPYRTIQHAIDISADGDTVLVNNGVFNERISYKGKSIVVGSWYLRDSDSLHITATIIDGDTAWTPLLADTGSVVRFVNGEDSTALLSGLTIRNGIGTLDLGGGLLVADASPVIANCRVTQNHSYAHGGAGFYFERTRALVQHCLVDNNTGDGVAAGDGGSPVIEDCMISGNTGVGVCYTFMGTTGSNSAVLLGDTVSNNGGNGIYLNFTAHNLLRNCQITGNGGDGVNTYGYFRESLGPKADSLNFSTTFQGCKIVSNIGRGIYANDMTYYIDSCQIDNNGVAIELQVDAVLTMKNTRVRRNGLGVYQESATSGISTFESCLFDQNRGTAIATSAMHITNCTFAHNSSSVAGSLHLRGSSWKSFLTLENSILCGDSLGPAIRIDSSADMELAISCTNIFGNQGGNWTDQISGMDAINGNMELDPLFCDAENGDYTLRSSSPCVPDNNNCEVWIGAVDSVGCQNMAPAISSPDSIVATVDSIFVYVATADDPDGPSLIFTFADYPDWLASDADSIFGIPHFGDTSTSFAVIASDGFASDTLVVSLVVQQATPVITGLSVDDVIEALHVVSGAPTICWTFSDPAVVQDSFKIAFGSDNDWEYAEMWNPSPFASPDTCLVYAGAPLQHGATYYVHVQAKNGLKWSPWYEQSFRMNTPPRMDLVQIPSESEKVQNHPEICLGTYADPESDTVSYHIDIYDNSTTMDTVSFYSFTSLETDTICWTVDSTFEPSHWYWYRAFAYDGYEHYRDQVVDSFFTACCGWYTGGYTGNCDCSTDGKINLADITTLIDHVYLSKLPLCCPENGNVDGSADGKMNLADITRLIDHVYLTKESTAPCQ